jgi:hypothetical protein
MQKTAYSTPVLISGGNSKALEKIGFQSDSNFEYNEKWLQDFLFENAQSLPIDEIDSAYSDIIPVCCELNTPAGPLDVLYVTSQGKLVVAEVKLWRNPEARRKVVAQVIDYAKELNKWDYEDLQREISKQIGKKGNVLFELAKSHWADIEEAAFVDGVSRSLKKGDLLLLIIGDGIQEGTENIADFMNNVGRLQFTLGLIEMSIYRCSDTDLLVQPRVLAKTVIVERIVIDLLSESMVVAQDEENPEIEQEVSDLKKYYTQFWREYIDQMQLDDVGIPYTPGTSTNFYLYPAINKQSWISGFFTKTDQKVGVYFRAPKKEYGEMMFQYLLEHKLEIDDQIGAEAVWENQGEGQAKYIIVTKAFDDVHADYNREAIFEFYNEKINGFVNAFRPLLKDYEP